MPGVKAASPALMAEGLGYRYGERTILAALSFGLTAGNICALLGPNGTGKSTLLRILAGVTSPDAGRVHCQGALGYVPQEVHPALPISVRDMVLLGRSSRVGLLRTPTCQDYQAVERALERVEASHLALRDFASLSGGERQLVLMARALAGEADILLLDEPTAAMDWHNQAVILRLLKDLADQGMVVVFSTHAPQHALEFASHALLLFPGQGHRFGPPADVMDEGALSQLYRLPVRRVELPDVTAALPVFTGTFQPQGAITQ